MDKINYSLEDFRNYENDEDFEFAYFTIDILSTGRNSHWHTYTDEVLRKYSDTALGKWVVSGYDSFRDDSTTHTGDSMKIIGIIPNNQTVKFRKENGVTIASVDAVVSKLYATDVYNVFRNKTPNKSVSIESLVNFTKETENYADGKQEKIVKEFNICAVTVLGEEFKPSCKEANIKMVKMSEDEIDNIEQEYVKYSSKDSNVKSVSMEDIMAKLENIENKLNKEEIMSDNKEEVLEVVDNVEENTMAETETTEVEEMACDEKEEMACDNKEKMEEEDSDKTEDETEEKEDSKDAEKMAELETKLSEAEAKIEKYELELDELRKFKSDVQMSQKNDIVNQTLLKAKDYCDSETYAKFEKSAENCTYEDINNWRNEVLASISDMAINKMSEMTKEDGVLEMGMPTETKSTNSLWD